MPKKISAIVITGNGTNCEMEMAHACRLAGFDRVDIVHISELLCGTKRQNPVGEGETRRKSRNVQQ